MKENTPSVTKLHLSVISYKLSSVSFMNLSKIELVSLLVLFGLILSYFLSYLVLTCPNLSYFVLICLISCPNPSYLVLSCPNSYQLLIILLKEAFNKGTTATVYIRLCLGSIPNTLFYKNLTIKHKKSSTNLQSFS